MRGGTAKFRAARAGGRRPLLAPAAAPVGILLAIGDVPAIAGTANASAVAANNAIRIFFISNLQNVIER